MNRDHVIEELKRFKEKNEGRYSILKIGLFGSGARGTAGPDSDLDMVVLLEKQDLFHLIGIKQDLEKQFNTPVDIVSYREKMNTFLKRRIDAEAVYV
ncbi:MAG: nucleotidyltransferase domain-containing protein [Deltaproteobacteria bacterium]|nr:nucleotidyltransferase domain-containing protein [Deltaproteobacteria bacterium]